MLHTIRHLGNLSGGALTSTDILVNRMTVKPTTARYNLIDACIKGLKSDSVWSKLDGLYVFAAHDSQAGILNWAQPLYDITSTGAPTFTTDRGYVYNSTNYHRTGFVPMALATAAWQTNSQHMTAYYNLANSGGFIPFGTDTSNAPRISTSTVSASLNNVNTSGTWAGRSYSTGCLAASRVDGTNIRLFDGTGANSGSVSCPDIGDVTGLDFWVGGYHHFNGTTHSLNAGGDGRLAYISFGGSLSVTDEANLRARLLTFLTAIGAN